MSGGISAVSSPAATVTGADIAGSANFSTARWTSSAVTAGSTSSTTSSTSPIGSSVELSPKYAAVSRSTLASTSTATPFCGSLVTTLPPSKATEPLTGSALAPLATSSTAAVSACSSTAGTGATASVPMRERTSDTGLALPPGTAATVAGTSMVRPASDGTISNDVSPSAMVRCTGASTTPGSCSASVASASDGVMPPTSMPATVDRK